MSPFDLLTIVFVTLKLTGIIAWSWWWVTAPTWGGLLVYLFIVLSAIGIGEWTKGKK